MENKITSGKKIIQIDSPPMMDYSIDCMGGPGCYIILCSNKIEDILLNIFKEDGIVKIILDMKKQMENNEKKRYFIQYVFSNGYYSDAYNASELKSKLLNVKQLNYLIQKYKKHQEQERKNKNFGCRPSYGLKIMDVNGVIIFECKSQYIDTNTREYRGEYDSE